MAQVATGSVVRQLGALFEGGSAAGLSDRQLIERFAVARDEVAFAALVSRHGPMVLGVCRDLLGDRQHAEDAFQAVYLVLARRAASIRDPDRLGNWLYGVAVRTSRCARKQIARRRRREEGGTMIETEPSAPPADRPAIDREQAEALHDEIDRLPGAFRLAVVLCYFEGLTLDEAARRLRCPAGTLRSRLARAREKLRAALDRRGVSLPAAALAHRAAWPSVSPLLCESTARAAITGAAVSAIASALAREVLRSMIIHKIRLVATTVLALAAVAGLAARSPAMKDEPARSPEAAARPRPEKNSEPADLPRMTLAGRVLDPDGRPVPGAGVTVVLRWMMLDRPALLNATGWVTGHDGRCDASGRFRIGLPRTSTARHNQVTVTAVAPGYGVGWAEFDPDAEAPEVDVTLRPEFVVRGRLIDVYGRPTVGVPVRVGGVSAIVLGRLDGGASPPHIDDAPWTDRPGWPASAISDADGRFDLHGLARDLSFSIRTDDPRFDRGSFALRTGEAATQFGPRAPRPIQVDIGPDPKPVLIALRPGRTITGRISYADTGRPAPFAPVAIAGHRHRADAEGRFRIGIEAGYPDGSVISVVAQAPEGAPYLMALRRPVWPKAAVEQTVDVALRRGVVVRGKVTEEGSGRPVAGAGVYFAPYEPETPGETRYLSLPATTGPDGDYRVAAPAGPGYLVVQGPSDDYVFREFGGDGVMTRARPGRRRFYAHAYRALDLRPDGPEAVADLTLKPGMTVHGRVVGPNGWPIRDASIFSRAVLRPMPAGGWRFWMAYGGISRAHVRDGRFVLHGLDPDDEVPAYFLDPEGKLGATVRLSGRSASGGPVTVRLEPCGEAFFRAVGPDGRPIARRDSGFAITMAITPGPSSWSDRSRAGPLLADEAPLPYLDPRAYEGLARGTDDQGWMVIPALIPGATYRITDLNATPEPVVRKEFAVKPGKTINLDEIRIEKPRK